MRVLIACHLVLTVGKKEAVRYKALPTQWPSNGQNISKIEKTT